LEETLGWVERLRPHHAVLTNLHTDMDFQTLRERLPSHIEPAFDGLIVAC
jgi:phosphoribosyl 1,2-cyclic phosphate phosphodiesterase